MARILWTKWIYDDICGTVGINRANLSRNSKRCQGEKRLLIRSRFAKNATDLFLYFFKKINLSQIRDNLMTHNRDYVCSPLCFLANSQPVQGYRIQDAKFAQVSRELSIGIFPMPQPVLFQQSFSTAIDNPAG